MAVLPFQHRSITLDFFLSLSWETGAYAEICALGHTYLQKLAQLSTGFQFVQQLVIIHTKTVYVSFTFPQIPTGFGCAAHLSTDLNIS